METARSGSVVLDVRGLWCTSCANALERALQRQPGVLDARVSFPSESATVEWDPKVTSVELLIRSAQKLGYTCALEGEALDRRAHFAKLTQDLTQRLVVAAFCSMWVMTAQTTLYFTSVATVAPRVRYGLAALAGVATLPIVSYCAVPFFKAAWRTVRARMPGTDCLVAMGAAASCLLSAWRLLRGESSVYFDSAAMIITFLLAGRWFEARVRRHASDAVRSLLELPAQTVRVLDANGVESTMLAKRVAGGSIIRILPGERLPLDGIITTGTSSLSRALLTGESELATIGAGAFVEAGALNGDGELLMRVTHVWGARRIDGIARCVRQMLARKTASQTAAERLTRHLVPAIGLVALLTLVGCGLGGIGWVMAVDRAVAVLVITCPCALGLAVPLALSAGAGRAARDGILFRDVEAIDKAGRLSMFFVDKTGTLTEGKPVLVSAVTAHGVSNAELIEDAALAERGSEHPIAAVIRSLIPPTRRATIAAPVGSCRAVPGAGVEWHGIDGSSILVGNATFLGNHGVTAPNTGGATTAVHVARDGRWRGTLNFADRLRKGSRRAIDRLKADGASLVMLTGDRKSAALCIAEALGLGNAQIFSDQTPEQKAARIRAAQIAGQKVAFVGDGLNDAPALAAADVGIAVGSASPSSMAAASIVLVGAGVEKLDRALALARRTALTMRQNLTAAVLYNLLALPAAVAGFVSPAMAAALMVVSSASVTLNTSRLVVGSGQALGSVRSLRPGRRASACVAPQVAG